MELMVELMQKEQDLREQIAQARHCLGFLASVVKSGEAWTETCQAEYDKAMGVLVSSRVENGLWLNPDEWNALSTLRAVAALAIERGIIQPGTISTVQHARKIAYSMMLKGKEVG